MSSAPPPAILLGGGVTMLGVLRSLGRSGIPVLVANAGRGFAAWSRWFQRATPEGPRPGALGEFLEHLSVDRGVLIPCSDDWALDIASLEPAIAERFPTSLPPRQVLEILVDKGRFAGLLAETGTPHPRTRLVASASDLSGVDAGELEHAFIKPRDSQAFFRRFGVKAFLPGSPGDLVARLGRLAEEGVQVIVQEYVPGPASNHIFVDGFIDAGGETRALLARRRLRMYPPHFGNSSYMRSVALAEVQPAIDAIDALLSHLSYRGIFSAEFKQDERDGVYRLLEVNARPWWYIEFAQRCGLNMSEMAYRDALGQPVDDGGAYQLGRSLIYPYYDVQACYRQWRKGTSPFTLATSWLWADRPLFAWDDPLPALREGARAVRNFTVRMTRRALGRVRPDRKASS